MERVATGIAVKATDPVMQTGPAMAISHEKGSAETVTSLGKSSTVVPTVSEHL
jgi:hypothetical protein